MRPATLLVTPFVIYCLPLGLWWLIRLRLAGDAYVDASFVSREAIEVGLLCHLTMIVLVMPIVLRDKLSRQWQGMVLLLVMPGALWSLFLLTGGLSTASLLKSLEMVSAAILLAWLLMYCIVLAVTTHKNRSRLFPLVQAVLVLVFWGSRHALLQWIGV